MMVYIFNTWDTKPAYHAYGRTTDVEDLTKCGLVMYRAGVTRYNAALRPAHADQFARACAKCFRKEAS